MRERIYHRGKYYWRTPKDHTGEHMFSEYDPCDGCAFSDAFGCTSPSAPCLSTGCGPTSILVECTDQGDI